MKRGLYIADGFNVNLDNVCVWIVEKTSIQLQMANSDEISIIDIHVENSDDSVPSAIHKVPINEFKRIEREISEYMTKEATSNKTLEENS